MEKIPLLDPPLRKSDLTVSVHIRKENFHGDKFDYEIIPINHLLVSNVVKIYTELIVNILFAKRKRKNWEIFINLMHIVNYNKNHTSKRIHDSDLATSPKPAEKKSFTCFRFSSKGFRWHAIYSIQSVVLSKHFRCLRLKYKNTVRLNLSTWQSDFLFQYNCPRVKTTWAHRKQLFTGESWSR